MKALQAIYDFWLDATGVCVGTYRRNVFVLMRVVTLVPLLLYDHQPWLAISELPFSFALWWALLNLRKRAEIDNEDQKAGRYVRVNRRALESSSYSMTAIITAMIMCSLFFLLDFFLSHKIRWSEDVAIVAAYLFAWLHECLMVRSRNADRFKIKSMIPAMEKI